VTSNRPDWLSYIGVAREISAITGKRLKIPATGRIRQPVRPPAGISVKVEDRKLCPRYTARVIRNVRVGESPAWLKKRIETTGLRSVNNIVDITNFCLFETGEPMHAFDLGKIAGGEIIVRGAKKGERIVTIEGSEKTLGADTIVIADRDRPIAIAGIMGGRDTEVTVATKDILLEAASFDPVSVRRTSRALGLSTESSYRFERRVDIENILCSSDRAALLISEIASGEPGELFDIGTARTPPRTVGLRFSRLDKISGAGINKAKAAKIAASLGLRVKARSKNGLRLAIPGFRQDIQDEIDVIEEVVRIYGYDRIPVTIPPTPEQPVRIPFNMLAEEKIRTMLTGLGMYEIITYSLTGKRSLEMAGIPVDEAVEIKNPLSAEQEVMRPNLIIGALNTILWNINRKNKDLKLFEIGNIYREGSGGSAAEEKALSISLTGRINPDSLNDTRGYTFFELKGAIESVLAGLGICGYSLDYATEIPFSPSACASIEINGVRAGVFGEISRSVLDRFDIKEKVYAAQVLLKPLMKCARLEKKFEGLPKYPSVQRDISVIVDKTVSNRDMLIVIRETGAPVLKYAKLIDRYTGQQIPDGKVSLTYRLEYQDPQRTLEENDVAAPHAKILRTLEERFNAKLRQ
jgi:phenylalanyl-tRNA synthetase beta chain